MREVVVKHEVYKFNELSEGAKEKALEQLFDINVDHDFWLYDDTYYYFANEVGIKVNMKEISFDLDRGSYVYFSKGGISIEDSSKLVEALIKDIKMTAKEKKYLRENADELYIDVSHYGGGSGANHLLLSYTADDTVSGQTQDAINEWFEQNVMNELLSLLKKEYEYLTSEEAIIETIEANEYEFHKNGKMF